MELRQSGAAIGAAGRRSGLLESPGPRVGAATGAAGIGLGESPERAVGVTGTPRVGHLEIINAPLGYVVQR